MIDDTNPYAYQEDQPVEAPKPSLLKRITSGIKGFFSHAVGYFPRGMLFTGAVFVASAAAEMATGYQLLGISKMSTPDLLLDYGKHLMFASAFSGVLGGGLCAYKGHVPGEIGAAASPVAAPAISENSLGKGLSKGIADVASGVASSACDAVVPGSGLPMHLVNHAIKGR